MIRYVYTLALMVPFFILPIDAATASEWTISKTLSLGFTYTDNVAQNSGDEKNSELIGQISPVLGLIGKGNSASFSILAGARYNRFFQDEGDFFDPVLNVIGSVELIDDLFFVEGNLAASELSTDADGSIGNQLDRSDNTTNVSGFKFSPYISRDFGNSNSLDARYTYSGVNTSDADAEDRIGHEISFSLSHSPKVNGIVWGFDAALNRTEFSVSDSTAELDTATTTVETGFSLSESLITTVSFGSEWTKFPGSNRTEQDDIWEIAASWKPSQKTSVTVGYGKSSIGNSPFLDVVFRTRKGKLSVGWAREISRPSTLFDDIFEPQVTGIGDTNPLDLDSTGSGIADPNSSLLTNRELINDVFGISYVGVGRLTTIALNGEYTVQETPEQLTASEIWKIQIGLKRSIGRIITADLVLTHTEELSQDSDPGFQENRANLTFGIAF